MSVKAEEFLEQLREAVATDQLKLPSLPDVALNIRKAVESDTGSAEQIAEILSQDPSMAARLLQLANSPLYRPRSEIDSLQLAVARLGVRIVRDLVTTLAMRQLFKTDSPVLEQYFRELWTCSTQVAAISRTLAAGHGSLENEQALLAGLIHNIGALPIIMLAEQDPALINDRDALHEITEAIQHRVGESILRFWHFPQSLIDVVCLSHEFHRQARGPADYVDLVQVALLQAGYADMSQMDPVPAAFQRLELDSSLDVYHDEQHRTHIDQTLQSLIAV